MAAGIDLYDGHNWVKVGSGNVRMYDGHNWQPGKMRLYDGRNWITALESRHVTTWEATWTQGYWSWGNAKGNERWLVWSGNYPLQGCYQPFYDKYDRGNAGGMIGFDDGNIRQALAGARIEKVEVFLYYEHWAYDAGGEAVVGTHNGRGWQGRFSEANHGVCHARYYGRHTGQWLTLPNWVGDNFRDNLLSGITVHADNNNLWQYGVVAGTNCGWKKPKLRITYSN